MVLYMAAVDYSPAGGRFAALAVVTIRTRTNIARRASKLAREDTDSMAATKLSLIAAAILFLPPLSTAAIGSGFIIVTAEVPKNSSAPSLSEHDVIARVNNQPATVTSMRTLRQDPAGLELWIMIDDGTNSRIGVQFNDIRDFIRQQPAQVKVAVGYLRNGSVYPAQKPTTDHEAAVKAIRLPTSIPGISASPYIALSDFLHKLPKAPEQPREIVLISSGIDPYYGPGPQNPYLLSAIEDAQKAGIPVNTIYFSSAGIAGRIYRQIEWGQNDLSELSDETGGRFYWEGDRNPVAFRPFFEDLNRRMSEQYLLSLDIAQNHSGPGRLQLKTESPGVMLKGPSEIYVPGSR